MGIKEANADMFKNINHMDPINLQFKMSQFDRGIYCECGEKINSKNVCQKKTCLTNKALENHVVFPTQSLLKELKLQSKSESLPFHWALMVEIAEIYREDGISHPLAVSGFTSLEEYSVIDLQNLPYMDQPPTFPWSDIKVGYTIAVLYAQRDFVSENCVMTKPDSCFVFKESLQDVKIEAEKLLNDADLISRNEMQECFGCGVQCRDILRCSGCKLAKYCSKVLHI